MNTMGLAQRNKELRGRVGNHAVGVLTEVTEVTVWAESNRKRPFWDLQCEY